MHPEGACKHKHDSNNLIWIPIAPLFWHAENLLDLLSSGASTIASVVSKLHKTNVPGSCAMATLEQPGICPESTLCRPCLSSFARQSELHSSSEEYWYVGSLTDDQAKLVISQHVQSIQSDYDALTQKIDSYGSTILNNWNKFTVPQRQSMIRNSLPGIAEGRWDFITLMYKLAVMPLKTRSKGTTRTRLLLPWLNLHDLSHDPAKLLLLLYHRTSHRPREWALFDIGRTEVGRASGRLEIRFNDSCFNITAENYGKHSKFDIDSLHRSETVGFPLAELIFEAQGILYKFLLGVVKDILASSNSLHPGKSKWDTSAAHSFTSSSNDWFMRNLDPPYLPPPRFDIEEMLDIAQTSKNDALDQLHVYQTDPASFQAELLELRREYEKGGFSTVDNDDGDHLTEDEVRVSRQTQRFKESVDSILRKSFQRSLIWDQCHSALWYARQLHALSDSESIRKSLVLPKALDWSLTHLDTSLHRLMRGNMSPNMRYVLIAGNEWSEPMRQCTTYKLKIDNRVDRNTAIQNGEVYINNETWKRHPLLWAVYQIMGWNWDYAFSPSAAYFLIGTNADKQNEHPELQDTHLSHLASDIASIFQLIAMLGAHFPRFTAMASLQTQDGMKDVRQGCESAHDPKIHFQGYRPQRANEELGRIPAILGQIPLSKTALDALGQLETAKIPKDNANTTEKNLREAIRCRQLLRTIWEELSEARLKMMINSKTDMTPDEIEASQDHLVFKRYKDDRGILDELETRLQKLLAKKDANKVAREAAAAKERQDLKDFKPQTHFGPQKRVTPTKRKYGGKGGKKNRKQRRTTPEPEDEPPEPPEPVLGPAEQDVVVEGPPVGDVEPEPEPQPEPEPEPEPADTDTEAKIPVSRDSLQVFEQLWPAEAGVPYRGSVRWTHIVNALRDAGMTAARTTRGGSHVKFTGEAGAITLPEPHGHMANNGAMPRFRLIITGSRLQRVLGWSYASFELRGRGGR